MVCKNICIYTSITKYNHRIDLPKVENVDYKINWDQNTALVVIEVGKGDNSSHDNSNNKSNNNGKEKRSGRRRECWRRFKFWVALKEASLKFSWHQFKSLIDLNRGEKFKFFSHT